MRVFFGIAPAPDVHQRLLDFVEQAKRWAPDARFVRPDGLHVTLKFIGEVSDQTLEAVKNALGGIESGSFPLEFKGFGFFPNERRPAHFWVGTHGGEALHALAAEVSRRLATVGIAEEKQPYRPHVTLARAGKRGPGVFTQLQREIAAMQDHDFGSMSVGEFYLYKSQLSPGGSHYSKIARFEL